MFHSLNSSPIQVISNPELDPIDVIEMSVSETGDPVTKVTRVPRDHTQGSLVGSHYDPSVMSLRAKLNLGMPLQKVNFGITENDPNVLKAKVSNFVNQVELNRSYRQSDSVSVNPSNSEPSNS